jgi:hypothetical protein
MNEEKNIPNEQIKNVKDEIANDNNSQEEIIEQTEAQISTSDISKSEIEKMEVHHHPEVEKKGFKEYLLEGLMIFLAVTMGFIAENIRETITEKRIEKEYIESFVSDLKNDIATFDAIIPIEETSIKGLDTLLKTTTLVPYTDSTIRRMYYLSRKYTMSIEPMAYTLRTITQLKNSGGLRLIADKKASDSIIAYNKTVDEITNILNFTTHDFMIPSVHIGNKIFNGKFLLPYNGESVINLLSSGEKLSLLTNDESIISEYTSLIYQVKQIRENYLDQVKRHEERAKNMILFFQKEYHLIHE